MRSRMNRMVQRSDVPSGFFLREEGFEPTHPEVLDPKSSASASSATLARTVKQSRAVRSSESGRRFLNKRETLYELGCEGFEPTTD